MLNKIIKSGLGLSFCLTSLVANGRQQGDQLLAQGYESRLCTAKVLQILGDLKNSHVIDYEQAHKKFTTELRWELKPSIFKHDYNAVLAPVITNSGELATHPEVAFHGRPNYLQINTLTNLSAYCDLNKSENDFLILHEVLMGLNESDRVFNRAIEALSKSEVRINRLQKISQGILIDPAEFGVEKHKAVPIPYIEIEGMNGKLVQVDLPGIAEGRVIVAINPGPYRHTPSDRDYQKYIPVGFGGDVWDLEDQPGIGEVARSNAEIICKKIGYDRVQFMSFAWTSVSEKEYLSEKIRTGILGHHVGYVNGNGSIVIGHSSDTDYCAGHGAFGECDNNTWPYRFAFFENIRCSKD